MKREELIEKIRTSTVLQEHFRHEGFRIFCPRCVDRVVAVANQSNVDKVIGNVICYGNRLVELEENQDPPPEIRKQHEEDSEHYRKAVEELYKIFKTPVRGMMSYELTHSDHINVD